jgi:hypothetical protein
MSVITRLTFKHSFAIHTTSWINKGTFQTATHFAHAIAQMNHRIIIGFSAHMAKITPI